MCGKDKSSFYYTVKSMGDGGKPSFYCTVDSRGGEGKSSICLYSRP